MGAVIQSAFTARRAIIVAIAGLAALVLAVPLVVQGSHSGSTTTTLQCSAATISEGSSVECAVMVTDSSTPASARSQPLGNVTVTSNLQAGVLDNCNLVAQTPIGNNHFSNCAVTLSGLVAGTHTLTASYPTTTEGGHTWSGSTGSTSLTVTATGTGTIIIEKVSLGGTGSFDFTMTDQTPFILTTTAAGVGGMATQPFPGLAPGSYTVTEAAEAGWTLTDLDCTPTAAADENIGARQAVITLAADQTVTCRFENTQHGSLTVVKNVTGPDATFSFNASANLGAPGNAFSLTTSGGTASQPFSGLLPGTYVVTENVPADWTLSPVTCAGTAGANVTAIANGASVNLQAGENVVCTFQNTHDTAVGTISITKITVDGSGTFQFTSNLPGGNFSVTTPGSPTHTVSNAVAGTNYTATEQVSSGWVLTGIVCSATNGAFSIGGTSEFVAGDTGVSASVSAGGSVACIFTNTFVGGVAEPAENGEGCPGRAAPAVASEHLRGLGIKPGGPDRPNLISEVANRLGEGASFEGLAGVVSKCDREAYEQAVKDYLDSRITALGLEATATTQSQGRGRPADVPRGRPHQGE